MSELLVGSDRMATWYFSSFPEKMLAYACLHICPCCLRQFALQETYEYHYWTCEATKPPGHLLYLEDPLAIFEVDPLKGAEEKMYCQRLSQLGKCFIKQKTLVNYVNDFKFYVLCEKTVVEGREGYEGFEVVGYFSKERVSEDGYNLACIVVLPPFMSKGECPGKVFRWN